MKKLFFLLLILCFAGMLDAAPCDLPVPGYQGFGASTLGGQGQTEVHVTNLNEAGAGSLREALTAGSRCVVFDVGGTINTTSDIYVDGSNLTIDGFTAPSPGITITGRSLRIMGQPYRTPQNNIIIRGLRFRDPLNDGLAINEDGVFNIVVDHCSFSMGGNDDGNLSITGLDMHDVTFSWCIFGVVEDATSTGNVLLGDGALRMSAHHNLFWGTNAGRNPRLSNLNIVAQDPSFFASEIQLDFRNNLTTMIGPDVPTGIVVNGGAKANIINNYYQAIDSIGITKIAENRALNVAMLSPPAETSEVGANGCPAGTNPPCIAEGYVNGNIASHPPGVPLDAWSSVTQEFGAAAITTTDACTAATDVLAGAGARNGGTWGLDATDAAYIAAITIAGCAPPSLITLAVPNGGENWQVGTSQTITWTSSGLTGGVGNQVFTTTGSWVAPAGVTIAHATGWGGGGAGGGNTTTSDGGGGGGGGAYSTKQNITVVPATSYTVTVGAAGAAVAGAAGGAGGDSWFSTTGTMLAKAGLGGGAPIAGAGGLGGVGGAAASGVGDTKFSGGNGGVGRNNAAGTGGGGGGSAGAQSAGGLGTVGTAAPGVGGVGGTDGGAAGGAGGGAAQNGLPGNAPGAGGGGSGDRTTGGNLSGGAGSGGRIELDWASPVNVRIELSRDGGTVWEDIIASTVNDGSHPLTVAGATTSLGRIRITRVSGSETDTSAANFSISGAVTGTLTVAGPLTGEMFKKGSTIPIRWSLSNVTGNVRVDLSRNTGSTWETITASTPAANLLYNWVAETPTSSNCKVRVVSLNDTSVVGTMSGTFRIGGTLTLFAR